MEIPDTHYENFVRKAELNKKIVRIPTYSELERNGFSITDLYYLVLPNGLTVNPETVDPAIFDEMYQGLFLSKTKVCTACGVDKPLDDFKKQTGRGGRRAVCLECENKAKNDIAGSIVNMLSRDQIQMMDGRSGLVKRYVNYADVVLLVNEAYQRGKDDGAVNVEIIRPSLDELLEMGA